jgi:signal transduction histidine kinase
MTEQLTSDALTPPNEARTAEIISALRTIEDLNGLSEKEFAWIATHGKERLGQDGDLIFSQGAPPHHLMFILRGNVLVHRHTSSPVSVLIGQTRRITGKTPFSRIKAWNADGRSSGETWILELHDSLFPELLRVVPSMTRRIVQVLLDRNREYTKAEEQIGKLAALNKLAANLAHELNNPASAAKSAASNLMRATVEDQDRIRYQLGMALGTEERLDTYLKWLSNLRSEVLALRQSTAEHIFVAISSVEDELMSWLESKGYTEAWKLAPMLVDCNIQLSSLLELERLVPAEALLLALDDLMASLSKDTAVLSVSEAADRIFRLITAVKDYSYMDRQPVQDVNIAESLDTVLCLFQPRLSGVHVERSYGNDVPVLKAFGGELNQAWSALIENALDAMEDSGTLTLSTKLQGSTILVEISDTGRGIPVEYADRVFEPFFTTKPFGKGLGLGLDTVQRVVQKHFGAVAFDSRPEKTTFHVRLPLDRTEVY